MLPFIETIICDSTPSIPPQPHRVLLCNCGAVTPFIRNRISFLYFPIKTTSFEESLMVSLLVTLVISDVLTTNTSLELYFLTLF